MARRIPTRAGGVPPSEGTIQGRGRAGSGGTRTRSTLNRSLTAVARDSPAASVSCYNHMARAGADKVTPTLLTYGILIGCCCRVGRLDLSFATFCSVIKKEFRVESITLTPLLKGLCADKRTSDAMDIVFRRMTELSCMPNVYYYNILFKGLCDENRSQEALELLHIMDDDRGGCPPDVCSYNTVIDGFFKEGDLDKAYNVVTYNSIIAALCKAQAMDKAIETGRTTAAKELYVRITEGGTQLELSTCSLYLHEKEEIARIKIGISALADAKKAARQVAAPLLDSVSKLESNMKTNLERAMKENDRVYLMRVPDANSLGVLLAASLDRRLRQLESLGAQRGSLEDMLKEMKRKMVLHLGEIQKPLPV
ncbi:hypothetical protein E2562_034928 [Oryza meyeriana var. granulata]|uniref:BRO1 domain-containing protein n=1 Tax=Oryza meyeriana var. granulata TaxID=110450 RepID=A0A6G1F1G5_9ORYZ|nr:hypothetical protein E2562_034928 [Oryza meyeriana var. granulata]